MTVSVICRFATIFYATAPTKRFALSCYSCSYGSAFLFSLFLLLYFLVIPFSVGVFLFLFIFFLFTFLSFSLYIFLSLFYSLSLCIFQFRWFFCASARKTSGGVLQNFYYKSNGKGRLYSRGMQLKKMVKNKYKRTTQVYSITQ